MSTNIVCSDTYIDAFSKLDKKTQKKSLETIRLMQRSLRSNSLKIEKLNTKLEFKSVRVTQDFRAIFTQSGNTVLLVYIAHHDEAYLWARRRLQGFNATNVKPAYEYFEQSKREFDPITDEAIGTSGNTQPVKPSETRRFVPETNTHINATGSSVHNQTSNVTNSNRTSQRNQGLLFDLFLKLLFFLTGVATGIIIMYFI